MTTKIKRILIAAVLVCTVMVAASAYGGGGVFQASQLILPGYTNMGSPAGVHGGYGYGASRGGRRYGGFGLAIEDQVSGEFLGGFGGVITGHQVRTGPFTLSLNIFSGIGYASPALLEVPAGVAFFAEANAEAGFAVLPWLQMSVYAGYQAIGSMDPAELFIGTRYAPVVGSRLTWGSF